MEAGVNRGTCDNLKKHQIHIHIKKKTYFTKAPGISNVEGEEPQ